MTPREKAIHHAQTTQEGWRKIRDRLPSNRRAELHQVWKDARAGIGGKPHPETPPNHPRKTHVTTRFLLTCAQNNTRLHDPTWESLNTLAKHYDATILVGRVMYDTRVNRHLSKDGRKKGSASVWFDPRIEPHVCDADIYLAPDLLWLGTVNIIPSARRPLSAMEGIGRGASGIIPHTQVAMESLPRMMDEAPRYNFTTGAVTQVHYIQRKAGRLAEFHHAYGALLVEVLPDDTWWARQVLADKDGVVCDLDVRVSGSEVSSAQAKSIVLGDLHCARLDPANHVAMRRLLSRCSPEVLVLHDTLDFQSRSHHLAGKPAERYRLWVERAESVEDEVEGVVLYLDALKDRCEKIVVVDSNHDRHLRQWLDTADWRSDPLNARAYLRWNLARLEDPGANVYEMAMREAGCDDNVSFLRLGESYKIEGVEHGLHGDLGVNGARASPVSLAKLGARSTVGHSHSPGIHQGVYTVGTSSLLNMGYNQGGATRWAHSHAVLYANGKRALVAPRGQRPFA